MRTDDTSYGADYWHSLDGGAGYQDSVMWEDLALITKEILYYGPNGEDLSNTHNLLDMGCAYGYLVRHLRRRGVGAWGADFSEYAIENSPDDIRRYIRKFDLTTGTPRTLAGYPFSRLTCYETLEHIPEESVNHALQVLYNALKPDGTALLTICTEDREGWDTDPTHVTIKSRGWWAERLANIGFVEDPVKQEFLNSFHLFRGHNGVFVVTKS